MKIVTSRAVYAIPAKLLFLFFLCSFLLPANVHAATYGDDITINKKNASLKDIMSFIERKTAYSFWYRKDIADKANKITISVKNASINEVLDLCAAGQLFTFHIVDQIIVLKPDSAFSRMLLSAAPVANGKEQPKGKTVSDGYQEMDEKSSTASITKLEGDQINQTGKGNVFNNSSVNGMLTQTDARGNTSMLIRGQSTINGSSEPLILVDNIPFQGNISEINPSTIESINVLKDAAATSIYGSRGANGVIVVTTKKAAGAAINPLESLITEKEGVDYYEGAHVFAILRHIGSRYDMGVTYKKTIPVGFYYGKIPVSFSSVQLLKILTTCGIPFHIEKPAATGSKEEIIVD